MIKIDLIVHFFGTHGQLRKSQRTTTPAAIRLNISKFLFI